MDDNVSEDVSEVRFVRNRPIPLHLLASSMLGLMVFVQWHTAYNNDMILLSGALLVAFMITSNFFTMWFVKCNLWLNYSPVQSIDSASKLVIIPTDPADYIEICPITRQLSNGLTPERISFRYRKVKYLWEGSMFHPVQYPDNLSAKQYFEGKGLSLAEAEERLSLYGANVMDVEIPTFFALFKDRASSPLFVFQIFCVVLSCLNDYWYYGLLTMFLLVVFESLLVFQQQRNMLNIRSMGNKPYTLLVYRDRKWRRLFSDELIPGDICMVLRKMILPCDMVLLSGSCIVDESLLTGESAPVIKEPLRKDDSIVLKNSGQKRENDDKRHVLHAGSEIVQVSIKAQNIDNVTVKGTGPSCLCYVIRTGFSTCQGQLLKTMLYNFNRPSANNLETFLFICFLLIFAIIAAIYVWIEGSKIVQFDSKYKLVLECIMIITDVIPPELSVELSNAVNSSLVALSKIGMLFRFANQFTSVLDIFCTEPYRIPFAGKLDICCFDKTGTLTADEIIIEGIVSDTAVANSTTCLEKSQPKIVIESISSDTAPDSIDVIACCHSLVNINNDEIVGDPLEKTLLDTISWRLLRDDVVVSNVPKTTSRKWRIEVRHHFSSALRRMCVIASNRGFSNLYSSNAQVSYIATVKGAPEALKKMFVSIPEGYDEAVSSLTKRGRRLLALGMKKLDSFESTMQLHKISRSELERDLQFCGLVVISCPLKPECDRILRELKDSSHYIKMVTGDNAMTACHVARQLNINERSRTLLIEKLDEINEELFFLCIENNERLRCSTRLDSIKTLIATVRKGYDICLTGDFLEHENKIPTKSLNLLLSITTVFARFSPQQKGKLINRLKELGFYTLMCGDGTNDVGALKNAHVGVAIFPGKSYGDKGSKNVSAMSTVDDILASSSTVKLGDASIAAPFTSKQSSIESVVQIAKQGRCTLVTTLQIFKILALNALILAYGRSVLYIQGVKFSDAQATFEGIFIAFCFLGVSKSKPLNKLSAKRPIPDIFNVYTVTTVLLQSLVHLYTLVKLNEAAQKYTVQSTGMLIDLEAKFFPTMVNSVIFATIMILQITNFAINHHGHPFMQSLSENKPLRTCLFCSAALLMLMVSGQLPDISGYFQLDIFPTKLLKTFITSASMDAALCYSLDRLCETLLCGSNKRLKPL